MNLQLENKTALVSASSSGIGLAIAQSLAAEGARTIINGRSDATVQKAIAEIKQAVPSAQLEALVADNSTAEGCALTIAAWPEVDILVNNLGIYEAVGFFDESDADWNRLFETNIMSGVRLSRHYLQGMISRQQGRVVFISSESGVSPAPEMAHYSATKTMQLGISRSLAELTQGTAVTVNSVLPGPTLTASVEAFVQDVYPTLEPVEAQKQFIKNNRPTSLIQRFIDPKEIGNVVAFVCSPLASAINGSNIRAEGGLVRSAF
ncbi:SDR family NAD(P)-dependent oxidoreductase [Cerasicoccus arenae]|uniref:3-oxoacyl-ACP reductase n=1 Tax=Cerasicoccus arenae TaxID=424488 RepID=A0A8J3DDV5_9BACT|nr:SDR family oxidoreductase [Cerasicoccus arenae]MBK1856651.1 SDR family oxidoreductase [Cerasicoccus arenae]GHC12225.1 3-oxoacyl-ACP reductase [Cerasicoccus arenae]